MCAYAYARVRYFPEESQPFVWVASRQLGIGPIGLVLAAIGTGPGAATDYLKAPPV